MHSWRATAVYDDEKFQNSEIISSQNDIKWEIFTNLYEKEA